MTTLQKHIAAKYHGLKIWRDALANDTTEKTREEQEEFDLLISAAEGDMTGLQEEYGSVPPPPPPTTPPPLW